MLEKKKKQKVPLEGFFFHGRRTFHCAASKSGTPITCVAKRSTKQIIPTLITPISHTFSDLSNSLPKYSKSNRSVWCLFTVTAGKKHNFWLWLVLDNAH